MKKRVAVNGFGRIGRLTLRNLLNNPNIEVVAINDLTDNATLAHLFKYDSAQGKFSGTVDSTEKSLIINGVEIPAFASKNPLELPWGDLGVDVVLECTGIFRKYEEAELHIKAGAKRVVISAPAKGKGVKTIVLGINTDEAKKGHTVVSNASCTTNCLAPMVKIIDDNFGMEKAAMTTVHAYTSDQRLQDSPHSDLRRARAAAENLVPTTTGAAEAVGVVIPKVIGRMTALAIRVPVITGSMTQLNIVLERETTAEEVNAAFKAASEGYLKGILEYADLPLVSRDIIGNTHSCIFDAQLTEVVGNLATIVGWYDNEAGYSARLADLAGLLE
jgi:glyceraldehyde 3-phosphate dehydrogenase